MFGLHLVDRRERGDQAVHRRHRGTHPLNDASRPFSGIICA
jgi:hypothetical protein